MEAPSYCGVILAWGFVHDSEIWIERSREGIVQKVFVHAKQPTANMWVEKILQANVAETPPLEKRLAEEEEHDDYMWEYHRRRIWSIEEDGPFLQVYGPPPA